VVDVLVEARLYWTLVSCQDRFSFAGRHMDVEDVIGQDAGQYTCTALRGDERATSPPVTINVQRQYTQQTDPRNAAHTHAAA